MLNSFKRLKNNSDKAVLLLLVLYLFIALCCGKRKPPLPPVERVPQKVSISGFQRGNQVILTWRMPARNAPDRSVLNIDRIDIYRLAEPARKTFSLTEQEFIDRSTLINSLQTDSDDFGLKDISFSDTLEFAGQPIRLIYAVRLVNATGQKASFSNFIVIESTARVAQSPDNLAALITEEAVELTWTAPFENVDKSTPANILGYNIYRIEGDSQTEILLTKTPVTTNFFADKNFQFGRSYGYFVRTVSLGPEALPLESLDSETTRVTPLDTFPPEAPTAITIAAAPNNLSIFFATNPEKDIAGYRVYRSTEREKPLAEWTLLTPELLTTNTYLDSNVNAGQTYYYYLTAADRAGNISQPSGIISETAP